MWGPPSVLLRQSKGLVKMTIVFVTGRLLIGSRVQPNALDARTGKNNSFTGNPLNQGTSALRPDCPGSVQWGPLQSGHCSPPAASPIAIVWLVPSVI
jgi:hypothetical protein